MMRDRARIFADEIGRQFLDGGRDRLRAAFDDRFAQPGDAGVGVNLQEQPARLDEKGFDFGDLEFVADADHRLGVLAAGQALVLRHLLQIFRALVLSGCVGGGEFQGGGRGTPAAPMRRLRNERRPSAGAKMNGKFS